MTDHILIYFKDENHLWNTMSRTAAAHFLLFGIILLVHNEDSPYQGTHSTIIYSVNDCLKDSEADNNLSLGKKIALN